MHALRANITSTWGTPVADNGTSEVVNSYKYLFNSTMKPKNCTVVAFVYDADTYEVLQAAEAKVVN